MFSDTSMTMAMTATLAVNAFQVLNAISNVHIDCWVPEGSLAGDFRPPGTKTWTLGGPLKGPPGSFKRTPGIL